MKNIKEHKDIIADIEFANREYDYCSGIQCPKCNSHYIRSANYQEDKNFKKLNKINNKKINITICEECSYHFVEDDGIYINNDTDEDYYSIRANYAQSDVYNF